jgi:putative membrane protein
LLIATRCFARQTSGLAAADRDPLLQGLARFAAALAAQLRGNDESIGQHGGAGLASNAANPTDAALTWVGHQCLLLVASGRLQPIHYSVLEIQLTELAHVQGACERIKNTPLPFSYSLLLHRTAYAFCLMLPFALAPSLGWWTPLPTFLVSYAFFGLDELSDPFGMEPNDLPLDAMVRLVEREMLSAMGETDLPPLIAASDYVLL